MITYLYGIKIVYNGIPSFILTKAKAVVLNWSGNCVSRDPSLAAHAHNTVLLDPAESRRQLEVSTGKGTSVLLPHVGSR